MNEKYFELKEKQSNERKLEDHVNVLMRRFDYLFTYLSSFFFFSFLLL
uniref:Uncharacterized protein n=1 Tax=Rhizophora mucronata TaxID=61149 RepID=A0A2P2PGZ4_RHIMU